MSPYPTDDDTTPLEHQLARLDRQVKDLISTEGWQRTLTAIARFHRYSVMNQILIGIQRPGATYVAGYHTWRTFGRQVMKRPADVAKGKWAIHIVAPRTKRDPDDPDKKVVTGFGGARVFDVSQTVPIEGSANIFMPPTWPEPEPCDPALLLEIESLLPRAGLVLAAKTSVNGARGYYERKAGVIAVAPGLTPSTQATTILHELGHHFDPDIDTPGYGVVKGVRERAETVAECVGWIMAKRMGIECDLDTTHYLASWADASDPNQIFTVLSRIHAGVAGIEALMSATATEEEAEVA